MTDISFTPADYTEIRRRSVALHLKIFKKFSPDEIKQCAKHLGIWRNKAVAVTGEEEMDLFVDYATYAYQTNGLNRVEKYRRLFSKDADLYEQALLSRMSVARYAIYQVEQTNGQDRFQALDVFSKAAYSILDFQMAQSVQTGTILAGYLIEFDGFSIQTGATVLVTRDILQADELSRVIDMIGDDQLAIFLNQPANGAKLARAVVSATIRLGQAKSIAHRTI